jgi:Domain of unknown function (DUF1816)
VNIANQGRDSVQIKLPFKLPFFKASTPWWVEVRTDIPCCTYYFGPFNRAREAKLAQAGYIDDLVQEKAFGITVEIKQCQPELLTIEELYGS